MRIPGRITKMIGNRPYSLDAIGRSSSQVLCFDDMVLKIEPQGEESDNEHRMMSWLAERLPVPHILASEENDGLNYLLMSKMEGEMSCTTNMLERPMDLVKVLGEGLKMLWKVDISNCPYYNSLDNKLKLAEIRINNKLCNIDDAEPDTYGVNGFEGPEELLQWLKDNRPNEELVFSHGDYCLPNIFLKDNKINGFIDLGRSGVADKYQDIALCYRSLTHNLDGSYGGKVYGEFDAKVLFDYLDIDPDWGKIKYYILLDELF